MKNILPFIFISALVFFSCSKSKSGELLTFPAGWEIKHDYMGCAIMGLSPLENEYDNFRENGNLVIEKLPQSVTATEYNKLSVNVMGNMLTNFEIISTSPAVIKEYNCSKMIYTHTMGQVNIKVLCFFIVDGKDGYVLTFSASTENFDKFLPEFNKIADTVNL